MVIVFSRSLSPTLYFVTRYFYPLFNNSLSISLICTSSLEEGFSLTYFEFLEHSLQAFVSSSIQLITSCLNNFATGNFRPQKLSQKFLTALLHLSPSLSNTISDHNCLQGVKCEVKGYSESKSNSNSCKLDSN